MEIIGLGISCVLSLGIMFVVSKIKNKNQLQKIFLYDTLITFSECLALLIFNFLYSEESGLADIFMGVAYIGIITLPVTFLFTGIIFAKTKITFKKRYILILLIPIISIIMVLTNNYHHLFVIKNSDKLNEIQFGKYFNIHNIYTDILYLCAMYYFIKYTIKNSGYFSKQAVLIVIGCAIPLVVNVLGTFGMVPMSIYTTPICFSITIILYALAIFKFQFLGVAPIALQKIVDRISDSYVVLGEDNGITDFNKTFLDTFKFKEKQIRGKNFIELLNENKISKTAISKIEREIKRANEKNKTISFEQEINLINKCFRIEITQITSDNGNKLGTLFLFKDITQHKEDMQTIKSNQDVLMEQERLASLGQLIGGIAHNLKTPIMSIAGAAEGLEQLIKEYDESIDDPLVNSEDHHEIAKEMLSWIPKIRMHTEYMSDVITTVKGQAVALSNDEDVYFTVGELVKKVNILMKHELKNAYTYLNVMMKTDENLTLKGDVNSLVQVVNNMISNSIQAYNGARDKNIDLEVNKKGSEVIFSVRDYAGGLPKEVQDKLFKEMVTTKGKNGTGLGLYMSYSNIKARFGGDITFDVSSGKGTTFNIMIPIKR